MSQRRKEFVAFSDIVQAHIENYTVPQYGDAPNDPISDWTATQCIDSVKRYCSRFNSNARGRLETLRDMVKIAHLAGLAFNKLDPAEKEILKIMKGEI